MGFCVASTRNGRGTGYVRPPMETCPSAITSSRALWTFAGARLISSTSTRDRKSTRLNSSHANISYAVFCLKNKYHDLSKKMMIDFQSLNISPPDPRSLVHLFVSSGPKLYTFMVQ